jgi:hypothetical protein
LEEFRAKDAWFGMVVYRDHPPQDTKLIAKVVPLSSDLQDLTAAVKHLKADGGGDTPEAVLDGIQYACRMEGWRKSARRFIVLIGDAPPHSQYTKRSEYQCTCGLNIIQLSGDLEEAGVQLHTIALNAEASSSFRELAAWGGGTASQNSIESAVAEVKQLLNKEYETLDFDQRVLDATLTGTDLEEIAVSLNVTPYKVAGSQMRLRKWGYLEATQLEPILA